MISNKTDLKKELSDVAVSVSFNEDIFENKIRELHERIDGCKDECDDIWEKMRGLENRNRRRELWEKGS